MTSRQTDRRMDGSWADEVIVDGLTKAAPLWKADSWQLTTLVMHKCQNVKESLRGGGEVYYCVQTTSDGLGGQWSK